MKRLILTALLALAASAASATPPVADEAIFVEGTRYNAVLDASQQTWRLLPATGRDLRLRVDTDCRTGTAPPHGLWLLTRDAAGRPQLVAPSATPLPAGHSGRIRIVDCGEPIAAGDDTLALPPSLLDWLQQNSGSIYVAR